MRNLSLAVRVVAIVAIFSVSAVGQITLYPTTSIDLPIEPAHAQSGVTLVEAAQHNDFPAFDALFSASKNDAFAELHGFWKWSLTDPVGGFYGADRHKRLAAEYADYAPYIADYRIVDAHGNSFYPSSETRAFLLRHAINRDVPRRPVTTAVVAARKPHKAVKTVHTPNVGPTLSRPTVASAAPAAASAGVVPASRRPEGRRDGGTTPQGADSRLARGLVLILAGLIGVGMLTLMLRTPSEEEPKEAATPIEPLRIVPLERAQQTSDHS